jgi:hypothetical protein
MIETCELDPHMALAELVTVSLPRSGAADPVTRPRA